VREIRKQQTTCCPTGGLEEDGIAEILGRMTPAFCIARKMTSGYSLQLTSAGLDVYVQS